MTISSVVFTNGDRFYEDLGTKYIQHDRGLFIWAPSGAGKTHYCKAQAEKHWIDGDDLWIEAGAQPDPDEKWWTLGIDVISRVDQRSDVITMEAKLKGFWVIGASCYWLPPDALVIPDWETHVGYIKHREENNYDGGATSDRLDQVKDHIEGMKKHFPNVPVYKSIEEAVTALANAH